ncbi:MAG: hypothetical protein WAM89_00410 [Terriglobales bacterium]
MGFKDFTGRLSGRSTEEKVVQYSEVYGEVLLGMHREIERFRSVVNEDSRNVKTALTHIADVDTDVTKKAAELGAALAQTKEYSERAYRFCEAAQSSAAALENSLEKAHSDARATRNLLEALDGNYQTLLTRSEHLQKKLDDMATAIAQLRRRVMWLGATIIVFVIGGLGAWAVLFKS